MSKRDDPSVMLLIIVAICLWLAWRYWSRREPPEARARRLEAEARARREAEEERARKRREAEESAARARRDAEAERDTVLGRSIPPDIQRDMKAFLKAGNFSGEEQSPLAYVGYKVGKTNGLPPWDRQRRLKACFQSEIPRQLSAKYQTWGRPRHLSAFRLDPPASPDVR